MSRLNLVGLVLIAAAGCAGGSGCGGSNRRSMDPFAYDRSKPLQVQTTDLGQHGPVNLEEITYTTADGQRVPALFARPRRTVACLIYQGGLGSTKEDAAPIWTAAARFKIATFTIDVRGSGARVHGSPPPEEVLHNAEDVRNVLTRTIVDLRRGLDYLETRSECRHRIGFLGFSMGAIFGALLAGDDGRIRTAVLASLSASWRGSLSQRDSLVLPGLAGHRAQLDAAVRTLHPYDPARWVAQIAPRPVMLVHGLQDPLSAVPLARELADAARQPKAVLYYQGGHNPFAGPHGPWVAKRVADFLIKTLGIRSP